MVIRLMTVTFNLIEGNRQDFPYEEMKHDYYHSELMSREIREKYNLTVSQWRRFTKQLKEEGLPLKSRGGCNHKGYNHWIVKNYYYEKSRGQYKIQKSIKGKTVFFGYCDTEKEAQERVAVLKANNWEGTL